MSVIALDIGTSNIKVLGASWDGRLAAARSAPTPVVAGTDGSHGFPADQVLERARGLLSAAAAGGEPVDTIVISCLGSAMVPVDAADEPLGPALSPADERPWRRGGLDERLSIPPAELRDVTGSDPFVASFLLHALWWRDERPAIMERLHRFRSLRGFVAQHLAGADAEDASWASRTMLLDLETNDWSDDILGAARLSRAVLPSVASSTATWPIRPDRIAELGLASDARLVIGAIDNCCSYLGAADPARPGLVNIVGTYEHLAGTATLAEARAVATAAGGIIHRYVEPDTAITMTRIPIGLLLARVAERANVDLDTALARLDVDGPVERVDLDAGAVDAALDDRRAVDSVVAGLLESSIDVLVRFAEAWAATGHPTDDVTVVGGGAREPRVLQRKANRLGRRLTTLRSEQGASLGALRLAAMAVRGDDVAAACHRFPNPGAATWSPDASA